MRIVYMFLYSVCKLWLQLRCYKHIESTLEYSAKACADVLCLLASGAEAKTELKLIGSL